MSESPDACSVDLGPAPDATADDAATDDACALPGAEETKTPLPYRLLTGVGDRAFCERVSNALDAGWVLYGSPTLTWNGAQLVSAQAVVLPEHVR